MLEHKPQAVIFDLDGLILDTEAVYRRAWQQAATDLGYGMSDDLYSSFVGRRTVDCETIFVNSYGSDFPLLDFITRSDQLCQEYVKRYGIPTKPGLYELLDFLDAQRLPKAIATSTERANALLCLGGLASRFALIVTGDEVAQGKPAPDIFLLAVTRLRLVPKKCLVLEDADAGVQAAHTAGIPVIMVPDLTPPSAQVAAKAACVCSSLHEVKDLLMALLSGSPGNDNLELSLVLELIILKVEFSPSGAASRSEGIIRDGTSRPVLGSDEIELRGEEVSGRNMYPAGKSREEIPTI